MAQPAVPDLQCALKLTEGIYRGSKIRIQGSIPPDAKRFEINLTCGPHMTAANDIAFHLNPRFTENQVVRNAVTTCNNGRVWGVEERGGGMPLARGAVFDVLMECDEHTWKVAINGKHFCEFLHRVQYQRITHLLVDGDVHIQQISL